jgi:hypothetical protein
MLTWTLAKPIQAGWYWLCRHGNRRPRIVEITQASLRYQKSPESLLGEPGSLWAGPIPSPRIMEDSANATSLVECPAYEAGVVLAAE